MDIQSDVRGWRMCLIQPSTRSQAGQFIDTLRLGIGTADQSVEPQLEFPEGISGHIVM